MQGVAFKTQEERTQARRLSRAKWAESNPVLNKQVKDSYAEKHKDTILAKNRAKYPARAKQLSEKSKQYRKSARLKVLEILGEVCVNCGYTDTRALQIDHVHGGGTQERMGSTTYYVNVLRSVHEKEGKYQILCANCNWIKRVTKNEIKSKYVI